MGESPVLKFEIGQKLWYARHTGEQASGFVEAVVGQDDVGRAMRSMLCSCRFLYRLHTDRGVRTLCPCRLRARPDHAWAFLEETIRVGARYRDFLDPTSVELDYEIDNIRYCPLWTRFMFKDSAGNWTYN